MASGNIAKMIVGVNGVSIMEENGRLTYAVTRGKETHSVGEWGRKLGIPARVIAQRVQKRKSIDEILSPAYRKQESHGKRGIPEYAVWSGMIDRCTRKKNKCYHYYGGRGITVFTDWMLSFQRFFDHVGPRPSPRHTLERIDNEKGYEPGNVRWATRLEQAHNMRTNVLLEFQGKTQTVEEWARSVRLGSSTLWFRLFKFKWSVEKALTTPVKRKN